MHAAAYFAPPARRVSQAHAQARHENSGADLAMEFTAIEGKEGFGPKAAKILLVAGLHIGLFAWLVTAETGQREIHSPVRLDVRTIAMPSASPSAQTGITEEAKPLPQVVKPAAPRVKQPAPQKQLKAIAQPNPQKNAQPVPQSLNTTASESALSVPAQPFTERAHGTTQESAAAAPATSALSGGATSMARFDADYLKNPAPDYPAASLRRREEGTVYLDVSVTADGRAADLRLRKSSGYARLDEAALETVRQWRFIPARRGTEAVAAHVVVPVMFRLGS